MAKDDRIRSLDLRAFKPGDVISTAGNITACYLIKEIINPYKAQVYVINTQRIGSVKLVTKDFKESANYMIASKTKDNETYKANGEKERLVYFFISYGYKKLFDKLFSS